ncbi:PAS domain S-box-containing protein [Halopelagius inordinatus]|uniref:histidine kinase n=1 Tax=Halopelagius inordinatus TaxID=553467 RepID=A0A1I2NMB3_9EURY|nr:PAS domain S-box protein [Halopelagius inordinatus]SFG04723.1 PAS domain S-box-containing protein [Halopelagius inordinatus]
MTGSPGTETDSEPHVRIRQQETVAELGQEALETDDIDRLMGDAAAAVAETLATEYAAVFELLSGGEELLLRRGVGWRDEVGAATVPADRASQTGYALRSERPVVVEDIRTEERFSGPELLTGHDAVSGISAVVGPVEDPWGVLGTYATDRRSFTEQDADFVRSVANVLTAAIEDAETKRHLRRRESELEEMFDRITDAFLGLDENWEITYVNERGGELLDPDDDGLIGENFWDPFEPALGTTFEDEYREAMETQEPTSFEEYYPPLETWFEVHAYPSDSGLSIYFRDVTEHRARERERELFRTLLDRSNDSILVIESQTGKILDANETACRHLGYERDELLELTVPEMERRFDDLEEWRAHVETVEKEGPITVEGVHERKDGTTYPAEVNVTHAELDREYMVAIARDITERRERERRLRESKQQYRTLAENFPNGVVTMFDNDLEYMLAAGRGFDELPLSPTDVEEESVRTVWPEHVSEAIESAFRANSDGEPQTVETEYANREWVVHVVPIDDQEGNVFGGMTIAQDITERNEYRKRLEESNERLEEFAYAASHDLQEPLRMVTSYLQLLESRYADALDEDGEEFIEYAVDGAERMRDMIDGLLEYSRVDTRGNQFESVDLNEILAETRENLRVKIEETDAEITAERLPRVRADPSQIQQVFQNLLSNAIEYTDDGPPRIRIEAERNGRKHRISVEDEGIGIDPEDRDRIFEVFQRLHTREEHSGTGIGLALCQRIVERHGGDIWADSTLGGGTTFSFTLPSAQTADE